MGGGGGGCGNGCGLGSVAVVVGGSGLGVFFGRREIHIQKERGWKREEEMRLKLKNNKEIIFEWSGKKYKTFDVGYIIKWGVKIDK